MNDSESGASVAVRASSASPDGVAEKIATGCGPPSTEAVNPITPPGLRTGQSPR